MTLTFLVQDINDVWLDLMHILKPKEQEDPPTFIDVHSKGSICDAHDTAGLFSISQAAVIENYKHMYNTYLGRRSR